MLLFTHALLFVVHQHLLHGHKLLVALFLASLKNLSVIKGVVCFSLKLFFTNLETYPKVPWPIFATFSYLLLSSQ